jgi:sn-glycerol 3-phosphate transport system substrate-binding protein
VRGSSIALLEEEGWFEANPNFTVAFDQLLETIPNTATAGALSGSFLDMRTTVGETLQRVLNGADPEEAMIDAKSIADARLEEYNANF